jgi:NADP-dependent 3-hydroxy acid dehydrogenase YdfG
VARRRPKPNAIPVADAPSGVAGKCVVINGGTTGIGLATVNLLASRGARVLLFGRDRDEVNDAVAQATAAGGEAYGVVADVTRQREVIRVFKEADKRFNRRLDILINNAAAIDNGVTDGDYDGWQRMLDTNVRGYIHCAREAIDRMRPRKDGHILMVGSMSADLREPNNDVYVATKAAVQALCEAMRKNVNKDGIRLSLIEPGAVDTPMQRKSEADKARRVQAMEMIEPADVAGCIVFALSQPKRVDIVEMRVRPLKQLI